MFSIACLLGIGLCLLIYLPAMDYTPYSIRGGSQTGGADYNYATLGVLLFIVVTLGIWSFQNPEQKEN